jgi:ABC-2 type transport system permease protein
MSEERKNSVTQQAFWAMVQRDLLAQWRDKKEFIFRVGMLPLVLIVVYGYVLPAIGLLPETFPPRCLRAWWG